MSRRHHVVDLHNLSTSTLCGRPTGLYLGKVGIPASVFTADDDHEPIQALDDVLDYNAYVSCDSCVREVAHRRIALRVKGSK